MLGIDRRIAYAQRKYHSGLMWIGVNNGLAGIKFSGSVKIFGKNRTVKDSASRRIINPTESLTE
ncbi:MAG: hypothetical protein N2B06_02270 [Clostridium sp.]